MKAVADKKLQQNIPEYIIYMYQMEDLLRAYQFNLEEVETYVIKHYPIAEDEKKSTASWFSMLIEQMKKESVTAKGHLSSVQRKVDELAQLHWLLLKEDPDYFEIYKQAKPHIINLIMEADGADVGHEIQVCLNAIYGLLLAKLHGREIPKGYTEATASFGDVLSYLNLALKEKKRSNT